MHIHWLLWTTLHGLVLDYLVTESLVLNCWLFRPGLCPWCTMACKHEGSWQAAACNARPAYCIYTTNGRRVKVANVPSLYSADTTLFGLALSAPQHRRVQSVERLGVCHMLKAKEACCPAGGRGPPPRRPRLCGVLLVGCTGRHAHRHARTALPACAFHAASKHACLVPICKCACLVSGVLHNSSLASRRQGAWRYLSCTFGRDWNEQM